MSDEPTFTSHLTYKGEPVKQIKELQNELDRSEKALVFLTHIVRDLYNNLISKDITFADTHAGKWVAEYLDDCEKNGLLNMEPTNGNAH